MVGDTKEYCHVGHVSILSMVRVCADRYRPTNPVVDVSYYGGLSF